MRKLMHIEHGVPAPIPWFSQLVRFLQVSHLLLWMIWGIYRERRRVMQAHARGDYTARPDSAVLVQVLIAFREVAMRRGVLLIKLGQFLSSRVDLLPEQAIAVLRSLQDEVPPASFDHVVQVIESELGKPVEEIFSILERKCIASASLGQVHKAVLASTGETVAVKIQRPHSEQLIRMDLRALRFVIWMLTRFVNIDKFIDLMGVYHEFKRTIYEEIDYLREAENAKRFQEMFKEHPMIHIPRVYDEYVSRRVLVLEWIDGIKINDYAALDAAGISRFDVARRTVCAYFYQLFEVGFFHADPHPGNVFVKKGSSSPEPILAFVDFGMVGSLTKPVQQSMKDVFLALLARDSRALVNALTKLGFIGEGANLLPIERAVSLMIAHYHDKTLGEVRELDIPAMVRDIGHLLYGQPVYIPAQFAFIGRAIGTLAGVSTGLAPELNFVEVAIPYARKFLGFDAEGAEQTLHFLFNQLLDTGRALLTLPRSLEQIVARLEAGPVEVRLVGGRPGGWTRFREPWSNGRFTLPFMFATSLAGSIFLLTDVHQFIAGWFCLGMAGLMAVRMVMKGG